MGKKHASQYANFGWLPNLLPFVRANNLICTFMATYFDNLFIKK